MCPESATSLALTCLQMELVALKAQVATKDDIKKVEVGGVTPCQAPARAVYHVAPNQHRFQPPVVRLFFGSLWLTVWVLVLCMLPRIAQQLYHSL